MGKKCFYCGSLLAKENARFCHECGRSQVSPDGHAPMPIKVRLAPKELPLLESPIRPVPTVIPPESLVDTPSPVPSLPERPVAPRRPTRPPQRPVRLTVTEETGPSVTDDNPAADGALSTTIQPANPVATDDRENLTSMPTLPDWRAELARLREEQLRIAPDASAMVEAEPPGKLSVRISPEPQKKLPDTPLPELEKEQASGKLLTEQTSPQPESAPSPKTPRRELRVRVWTREEPEETPQEPTEKLHPEKEVSPTTPDEQEEISQEDRLAQNDSAVSLGSPPVENEAAKIPEEPGEITQQSEEEQQAEAGPLPAEEAGEEEPEELQTRGKADRQSDIEDLPTLRLPAAEPPKAKPRITIERTSTPAPRHWNVLPVADVTRQPTQRIAITSSEARPGKQQPGTARGEQPVQTVSSVRPSPSAITVAAMGQDRHVPAPVAPSTSLPSAKTGTGLPAAETRARPRPRPRKPRGRLAGVLIVLLILLGGGTVTALNWNWVAQFFVVPATNQPYQTFQNHALGIALDYTQGWSVKVDQAHSMVSFADSTRTNQASLSVARAIGSLDAYLKQQSTRLGISGPQTKPTATFARSTWQVLQGTVTQSGATYTIALYVTQHNNHFYTLMFLAPPVAFMHADQANFAHMRASLSFLS